MSCRKNARLLAALLWTLLSVFSTVLAQTSKKSDSPAPIGTAKMLENGTIELRLFAADRGVIGHTTLRYPPEHKEYQAILRHLGGLKPGEVKSVQPWPLD